MACRHRDMSSVDGIDLIHQLTEERTMRGIVTQPFDRNVIMDHLMDEHIIKLVSGQIITHGKGNGVIGLSHTHQSARPHVFHPSQLGPTAGELKAWRRELTFEAELVIPLKGLLHIADCGYHWEASD